MQLKQSKMGKSISKESDVSSTGVVTSNFIVDEQGISSVPLDIKILMYLATMCILLSTALKIRQAYRRGLKRDISRSVYLRPLQRQNAEDAWFHPGCAKVCASCELSNNTKKKQEIYSWKLVCTLLFMTFNMVDWFLMQFSGKTFKFT